MTFVCRLAAVLIATFALCGSSIAQSRRTQNDSLASTGNPSQAQIKERLNAWTIGLAGGLLEGAPIRLATDIARVVNDGGVMHVLPIVTRGPTENVNDLLYLKGVDAAIINSDSLEEYKSQVPQIQQRITYIISLFPSELHIFVRPEIKSLQDLVGKKVNFNTQGTAAAYSGPLIFSRLGLEVEKMFIPHPVALEQLRRGEIAGVVFVTSKPVDAFLKGRWDAGYKFCPSSMARSSRTIIFPLILTSRIIQTSSPKERGSPRLLYPPSSPRTTGAPARIGIVALRALSTTFSAGWINSKRLVSTQNGRDVNLSAKVPGLERFRAAQEWLDRTSTAKQSGNP